MQGVKRYGTEGCSLLADGSIANNSCARTISK